MSFTDSTPAPFDQGAAATAPEAATAPATATIPDTHVITGDQSLDDIGQLYGLDGNDLYNLNASELDRQAAARGLQDSEGGRIVFPGGTINLKNMNVNGPTRAQVNSNASELAKYHQLLTSGAITQAEFDAKKAQLLV